MGCLCSSPRRTVCCTQAASGPCSPLTCEAPACVQGGLWAEGLQACLMHLLPCTPPPPATASSSRAREATGKGSTLWSSCCRRR